MEDKKRSDSFLRKQKENSKKIWKNIKYLILQVCEQNKSELNLCIESQVENLSIFAKDKSPKSVKDYYYIKSHLRTKFQKLSQKLGFNLSEQIIKSFSEQFEKDNEDGPQQNTIQDQLYNQMVYLGSNYSSIHFSKDSRFILKGIPQSQFNTFLSDVNEVCLKEIYPKQNLLSTRIFGLFEIECEDIQDQDIELPYNHFILMENILYDWDFQQCQIQSIYDLKGSSVGRQYDYVENNSDDEENNQEETKTLYDSPKGNKDLKCQVYFGKDNDFKNRESDRNILKSLPIELKQEIIDQLKEECKKYESKDLMDYSLMVVIGENSQQPNTDKKCLVENQNKFRNIHVNNMVISIGLIDYLCQFNFRKSLESTFKSLFISNSDQISCVEPSFYYERIIKFAEQEIFALGQD